MDLTRTQLLASLGARDLGGADHSVFHHVEDAATGERITAAVGGTRDGFFIGVTLCHGTATRSNLPFCIFQAMATAGRFAPITFVLGGVNYLWDGVWSVFTEADAHALVRAVLRELEAKRLPDLDALLTPGRGQDPFTAVAWRP